MKTENSLNHVELAYLEMMLEIQEFLLIIGDFISYLCVLSHRIPISPGTTWLCG